MGNAYDAVFGDLNARGDRITAIGSGDTAPLDVPKVGAHYHSYDTLLKGRFEEMPFDVWALHSQPA